MLKSYVVVVALFLCSLMAGCATGSGGGTDPGTSDEAVQTRVVQRLRADLDTAPLNLGVQVEDGVATLSGRIDAPATRMRAVSIVRGTPGVRGVIDKTYRF